MYLGVIPYYQTHFHNSLFSPFKWFTLSSAPWIVNVLDRTTELSWPTLYNFRSFRDRVYNYRSFGDRQEFLWPTWPTVYNFRSFRDKVYNFRSFGDRQEFLWPTWPTVILSDLLEIDRNSCGPHGPQLYQIFWRHTMTWR